MEYNVTRGGTPVYTGTFQDCWNYLLTNYRESTVQSLTIVGIKIEPVGK